MTPLNDDDLNSLFEHARSRTPQPSSELKVRTLRAYQEKVTGRRHLWRFLLRPIAVPLPVGLAGAVLLVWLGAFCERRLTRPPRPPVASLFREFQPVREIRPHVVGSIRDEQ